MASKQESQCDLNSDRPFTEEVIAPEGPEAAMILLDSLLKLATLCKLELRTAFVSVPSLLTAWLLHLHLLVLLWLSISATAAWLMFHWTASAIYGLGLFLGLQVLVYALSLRKLTSIKTKMSLPLTREQIKLLKALAGSIGSEVTTEGDKPDA